MIYAYSISSIFKYRTFFKFLIVKMAQNNNPEREILTLDILYKLKWLDKRHYDQIVYTESHMPIGKYVVSGIKVK